MADQKTLPNAASVSAFVNAIEDPVRRADARTLVKMMTRVSGKRPKLWTGGIVGFGTYHYKYDSGHEGFSCLVGFAPRKTEFSIYLMGSYFPDVGGKREALLKRLGRHRMGKACLYVKKLEDIDLGTLEELAALSVSTLRERYPSS